MIDIQQFRNEIIRPALNEIDMYSEAAEELVLGTAIQESRLTYLVQIRGPAKGLFQMEPATHNDIWINWVKYKPEIAADLKALAVTTSTEGHPLATEMVWNLLYAAAMCRVHYRRKPGALPAVGDLEAQAAYWKKWYNTELGAGTTDEYVRHWKKVME